MKDICSKTGFFVLALSVLLIFSVFPQAIFSHQVLETVHGDSSSSYGSLEEDLNNTDVPELMVGDEWTYHQETWHNDTETDEYMYLEEEITYAVEEIEYYTHNKSTYYGYNLSLEGEVLDGEGQMEIEDFTIEFDVEGGSISGYLFLKMSDLAVVADQQYREIEGIASTELGDSDFESKSKLTTHFEPPIEEYDFPLNLTEDRFWANSTSYTEGYHAYEGDEWWFPEENETIYETSEMEVVGKSPYTEMVDFPSGDHETIFVNSTDEEEFRDRYYDPDVKSYVKEQLHSPELDWIRKLEDYEVSDNQNHIDFSQQEADVGEEITIQGSFPDLENEDLILSIPEGAEPISEWSVTTDEVGNFEKTIEVPLAEDMTETLHEFSSVGFVAENQPGKEYAVSTLLINYDNSPIYPNPPDGAENVDLNPELSVLVGHHRSEEMNVTFYDSEEKIGYEENVTSGSYASTIWEGLEVDTTYEWYAVAEDDEEEYGSEEWSFTTAGPISTESAENVGTTQADLGATVNDMMGEEEVEVYVRYRKAGEEEWMTTSTETLTEPDTEWWTVDDLESDTEYKHQAVGVYGEEELTGEELTFTTSAEEPEVSTEPAENIGSTQADLGATVDEIGDYQEVDVYVRYREAGEEEWMTTSTETLTEPDTEWWTVDDLESDTQYEYQAVGEYDGEETTGLSLYFWTIGEDPPRVSTEPADDIIMDQADLGATVDEMGDYQEVDVYVRYREVGEEDWMTTSTETLTEPDTEWWTVDNLESGTEYEHQAVGDYDGDEVTGDVLSFTTDEGITTEHAENILVDQADIGATVEYIGDHGEVEVYVRYRKVGEEEWMTTSTETLTEPGTEWWTVEDLESGTEYEHQAVGDYDGDEVTGDVLSFTTDEGITTEHARDIGRTQADLGVSVNHMLEEEVDVYVRYRKVGEEDWMTTSTETLTEPDTEWWTVDDLESDTEYEHQAVGVYGEEELTGEELTFTTSAEEPEVSTEPAENIGSTQADLGATVGEIGDYEDVEVYVRYRQVGEDDWMTTPTETMTETGTKWWTVENLESGTEYQHQAVGEYNGDEEVGEVLTILTDETVYELTVKIEGEGNVVIHAESEEEIIQDNGSVSYPKDTEVRLEAEADEDWEFNSWDTSEELDIEEGNEKITLTLQDDHEIKADFNEEGRNWWWMFSIIGVMLIIIALLAILILKREPEEEEEEEEKDIEEDGEEGEEEMIYGREESTDGEEVETSTEMDEKPKEDIIDELSELKGVGSSKAETLYENGYRSINEIKDTSKEELQQIQGIGPALSEDIKESASKIDR